ncbi:transposase [Thalassotalea sp. LPB0316]|uniref:transposase n=1 Tax=Thalassotalea sp. LPB0316 TaxID=2769490 RepID=UPI0018676743|nr:transposase [Thalassotalea sp. LPB0316]QOL24466.1 transposase [Thalassotalea sp. LPB0316]
MRYKSRKQYSECCKMDVVRQSVESIETLPEFAKRVGINVHMIQRWRKKYLSSDPIVPVELKKLKGPDKSYKQLEKENERLKKQLERANEDIEILKKAEEFFKEKRQKNSSS